MYGHDVTRNGLWLEESSSRRTHALPAVVGTLLDSTLQIESINRHGVTPTQLDTGLSLFQQLTLSLQAAHLKPSIL